MTPDHDIDRAFRSLLDDDVTVLPDRVLDSVLAELPVTRQQRRRGPRWGAYVRPARFAMGAAAIVVVVGFAISTRTTPGGIGGAAPSSLPIGSTSPSPSPSITVSPGYGAVPSGWPTPQPLVPGSPLPEPVGSPLPSDLVGRQYNTDPLEVQGDQAQVLTLRGADDPHCLAMYEGRSSCYTILWTPNYPLHVQDPAVRGPARIEGTDLVLGFALVPTDPECEGSQTRYTVSADGWTLTAVDTPPCGFPATFTRH